MINLRKGNSGPFVQMLQLALIRAGYDIELNGDFDDTTEEAVKEFQQSNNLSADGIVGELTWFLMEPYIKGYRRITTNEDTTLQKIAEENSISVDALKTANPQLMDDVKTATVVIVPYNFDIVPQDIKYTGELVSLITDGITTRYPFAEKSSIGTSIMGQDLLCIKIGKGNTEVFYNGTHHANEWLTTPLLLRFLEEYSKAYSTKGNIFDISAEELYNTKTLYTVACVNPDGMDVVNGALPVGDYYNNVLAISKNYPQIPFPDGWKANVAGTDLNLNYPANWNKAKETKYAKGFVSPAPRDFVGTEPLSAQESKEVYDFTTQHSFALTLSYHSQGEVIYWKYLNYQPANSYKIGQELARVSGYQLELTPAESAYAGYKDWFIQAFNKPGYTIEVGLGVSPLPWSQFEKIYNDNIGLLVTALEMS